MKLMYTLLLTSVSFAAASQSRSLESCIQTALDKNVQVQNSALEIKAADYKIKETKSALLPTVEMNGQYQYYMNLPSQYAPASAFGGPEGQYNKLTLNMPQTVGANIQVRQNFFNKAALTGVQAAAAVKDASYFQAKVTRENVVYQVTATYFTIQVLQDNLIRLRENIVNLEKTVKINEGLKNNEVVAGNVYNRLSINLENLRNQYETQKLSLSTNLTTLKYLMNVSDSVVVDPFDYHVMLEEQATADLSRRPDLQLQEAQIRLAQYDKKSVVAKYFPVISGGQSYASTSYYKDFAPTKQINNDWINSNYFFVSVKIPVFDGFEKKYQIKQKDVAIQKNINALSMMKSEAEREFTDATNNYATYKRQLLNTRKSLDLATELFNTTQGEYTNGLTSTTELLNAQNDLSNARNNYSVALLNLKLAELSLKKANGTLMDGRN